MKKFLSIFLVLSLLSVPAFANSDFRKTVTAAGTAEAISASATGFASLTITALPANTGTIAVGYAPIASASTSVGVLLAAGEKYTMYGTPAGSTQLLSNIKIDSTVNGEGVSCSVVTA